MKGLGIDLVGDEELQLEFSAMSTTQALNFVRGKRYRGFDRNSITEGTRTIITEYGTRTKRSEIEIVGMVNPNREYCVSLGMIGVQGLPTQARYFSRSIFLTMFTPGAVRR